jgi:D-alanyl-D-alanine carboxypeptidase (penicillin-binding protein 5/6)
MFSSTTVGKDQHTCCNDQKQRERLPLIRKFTAQVAIPAIILITFGIVSAKPRAQIPDRVGSPYTGAITVDAASGKVLFEDHADAPGYPASVQKVMTLMVVLDKASKGALKLDEMVPVPVEASKMGGSQVYLDPRESFPVEELLYALIVESANDAAVALAIHVGGSVEGFVDLMNQNAKAIGMTHTVFHSVHGLPPSQGAEPDVTTARDLALLGRELILKYPQALKYTSTVKREFRNGTFIMRSYPGCDGLKTGYYKQAGYSIIATAARNNARVITVVLGADKSKNPRHPNSARDEKAAELMTKGFAELGAMASQK